MSVPDVPSPGARIPLLFTVTPPAIVPVPESVPPLFTEKPRLELLALRMKRIVPPSTVNIPWFSHSALSVHVPVPTLRIFVVPLLAILPANVLFSPRAPTSQLATLEVLRHLVNTDITLSASYVSPAVERSPKLNQFAPSRW